MSLWLVLFPSSIVSRFTSIVPICDDSWDDLMAFYLSLIVDISENDSEVILDFTLEPTMRELSYDHDNDLREPPMTVMAMVGGESCSR